MEIKLINIVKRYLSTDDKYVDSVNGVNIDINYGSFVGFVGPSGSGKTTLLNLITGNLKPTAGEVYWGKYALSKTRDSVLSVIRRKQFGIIFQEAEFLPELTVEDNILLPLVINYESVSDKKKYYQTLMERLKLTHLRGRMPYELSGGEKKKAAIARALMSNPEILVADEPTANLDEQSAREVYAIFSNLNKLGLTMVVATHDQRFSEFCREIYTMKEGRIEHFRSNDVLPG